MAKSPFFRSFGIITTEFITAAIKYLKTWLHFFFYCFLLLYVKFASLAYNNSVSVNFSQLEQIISIRSKTLGILGRTAERKRSHFRSGAELPVDVSRQSRSTTTSTMSNVSTGSLFSLLASEKDEIFVCHVRLLVCLFSCCWYCSVFAVTTVVN